MVLDDGKTLAYFEKANDEKPKGNLSIENIFKIVESSNGTDFEIKYGDKNFLLRAEKEEIKKNWV
jgi:hypothetical protein